MREDAHDRAHCVDLSIRELLFVVERMPHHLFL